VVSRGEHWLDGVMKKQIPFDEIDATQSVADMICSSPHYDQIRVIMLDNLVLGNTCVVDTLTLHEKTDRPVILVSRKKTVADSTGVTNVLVEDALSRAFGDLGAETEIVLSGGDRLFVWASGLSEKIARTIVIKSCLEAAIPEGLRICDLIATAFSNLFQKEQKV